MQHLYPQQPALTQQEYMHQQQTVIGVVDAAEFLKVSERTIHNWVKQGIIRSYKPGGKRRFILQDLIEDVRKHGEFKA